MKAEILDEVTHIGCCYTTRYKAKFTEDCVDLEMVLNWFSRVKATDKKKHGRVELSYFNDINNNCAKIYDGSKYYISRKWWKEHYGDKRVELLYIDDGWGCREYIIKLYTNC